MILSVLNWLWKVPTLIVLTLIAYIINPIIALFIVKSEESETTGFPSLYPGMPREFLIKPLRIWQSEDAPVDEYYWANYEMDGALQRYLRKYYETSAFVRYIYRVMWLYRNPAYGFGNALGYDSTGMYFTVERNQDHLWRTGVNNASWWIAKNELLNPVTYKWKVDGSDGQGFIAHELQAVFPDAVTGTKDAVDDEGNPQYQGVDTSFLVGHLVACVKELKAELDSVKAELETLKSV